jgi:hypothetical protein
MPRHLQKENCLEDFIRPARMTSHSWLILLISRRVKPSSSNLQGCEMMNKHMAHKGETGGGGGERAHITA